MEMSEERSSDKRDEVAVLTCLHCGKRSTCKRSELPPPDLSATWLNCPHCSHPLATLEQLEQHIVGIEEFIEVHEKVTSADHVAAFGNRHLRLTDLRALLSAVQILRDEAKAPQSATLEHVEELLAVGKRAGEAHAAGFAGKCCETTLYIALRAMRAYLERRPYVHEGKP
jgi:hypothetical protein